jgi:hypothetical protein
LTFLNFLGVKPSAELTSNQLMNAKMEAGGWRPRQRGLSGAATQLFDAIAQCFGVRERQLNVLAKQPCVVGVNRRCVQQTGELGYVIVRKELGGVLVQEPRGGENIEPLVPIEFQDIADAIQDFTANPAVTRFQPTERAVVNLGQVSDAFLRQSSVIPEACQERPQPFDCSRGHAAVNTRHFSAPI